MGNINTADGSTIKAIYDFLIAIPKKDYTVTLSRFSVTIEDNVTSKKRKESFTSIDEFLTRFNFVLEKINPQCDIGPYFRLVHLQLDTNKGDNKQKLKYYYDSDNTVWKEFHTIESQRTDKQFWLRELNQHSERQEFLITLRKARYVDPCYVDDRYIDEKYEEYYS